MLLTLESELEFCHRASLRIYSLKRQCTDNRKFLRHILQISQFSLLLLIPIPVYEASLKDKITLERY